MTLLWIVLPKFGLWALCIVCHIKDVLSGLLQKWRLPEDKTVRKRWCESQGRSRAGCLAVSKHNRTTAGSKRPRVQQGGRAKNFASLSSSYVMSRIFADLDEGLVATVIPDPSHAMRDDHDAMQVLKKIRTHRLYLFSWDEELYQIQLDAGTFVTWKDLDRSSVDDGSSDPTCCLSNCELACWLALTVAIAHDQRYAENDVTGFPLSARGFFRILVSIASDMSRDQMCCCCGFAVHCCVALPISVAVIIANGTIPPCFDWR